MKGNNVIPFERNIPKYNVRYDEIELVLKAIIGFRSDLLNNKTIKKKVPFNGQRLSYILHQLCDCDALEVNDVIISGKRRIKKKYYFVRHIKNEDEIPKVIKKIKKNIKKMGCK